MDIKEILGWDVSIGEEPYCEENPEKPLPHGYMRREDVEVLAKAIEDLYEEDFAKRYNPDYLDFQRGVEAQTVICQERVESIIKWIDSYHFLDGSVEWQERKKQEGL